jgi:hypothetical protein
MLHTWHASAGAHVQAQHAASMTGQLNTVFCAHGTSQPHRSFSELAAQAACSCSAANRAHSRTSGATHQHGVTTTQAYVLDSTPSAPAALVTSSEPSSLLHLSPSQMQTPITSPKRCLPLSHSNVNSLAACAEDDFYTPERAVQSAGSDIEGAPSQVWAPNRHDAQHSRFGAFRRSCETSSDEGSPILGANMASPMFARCALASNHGECRSSDEGGDARAGRLVCNLAERFNNAQLYDDINHSP